jgi:hypothetical protein
LLIDQIKVLFPTSYKVSYSLPSLSHSYMGQLHWRRALRQMLLPPRRYAISSISCGQGTKSRLPLLPLDRQARLFSKRSDTLINTLTIYAVNTGGVTRQVVWTPMHNNLTLVQRYQLNYAPLGKSAGRESLKSLILTVWKYNVRPHAFYFMASFFCLSKGKHLRVSQKA